MLKPIEGSYRDFNRTSTSSSGRMVPASTDSANTKTATEIRKTVEELCAHDRRAYMLNEHQELVNYLMKKIDESNFKAEIFPDGITSTITKDLSDIYKKHNITGIDSIPIMNIRFHVGDKKHRKFILGAHYDTDPNVPPGAGADDNASGVAFLLELARRMKKHEKLFKENHLCLEFAFFDMEELPLSRFGSKSYAINDVYEQQLRKLMINFDMLGFYDDKQSNTIIKKIPESKKNLRQYLMEKTPGKEDYLMLISQKDQESIEETNKLEQELKKQSIKLLHLKHVDFGGDEAYIIGESDHMSFSKYAPTIDVSTCTHRNPHYHSRFDTPATLDYEKISKLVDGLEQYLLTFIK